MKSVFLTVNDFVKGLIQSKGEEWDIKIMPQMWGECPWGFLSQDDPLRQRFIPGLMHAFVFWGFIAFSLITIDHFLRGFNTNLFSEKARLYYSYLFGIPWSLLVLIGILLIVDFF